MTMDIRTILARLDRDLETMVRDGKIEKNCIVLSYAEADMVRTFLRSTIEGVDAMLEEHPVSPTLAAEAAAIGLPIKVTGSGPPTLSVVRTPSKIDALCECAPPWNDGTKHAYDNGDHVTRCSQCHLPLRRSPVEPTQEGLDST